ncbi:MAG: hypothetical protein HQ511_02310 [Rhodospirillales bacterium]|nr:hypothetical protein [Rhodospirillales bacterium]
MRRMFASILVFSALSGPALAEPKYPIEAWCKSLTKSMGGGVAIESQCLNNEKKAQQKVRVMGYTPERVTTWCNSVATEGTQSEGSYQVYLGCVQDELAGRGSAPQ